MKDSAAPAEVHADRLKTLYCDLGFDRGAAGRVLHSPIRDVQRAIKARRLRRFSGAYHGFGTDEVLRIASVLGLSWPSMEFWDDQKRLLSRLRLELERAAADGRLDWGAFDSLRWPLELIALRHERDQARSAARAVGRLK